MKGDQRRVVRLSEGQRANKHDSSGSAEEELTLLIWMVSDSLIIFTNAGFRFGLTYKFIDDTEIIDTHAVQSLTGTQMM